jgi:hypothetical protein
MLSESQLNRFGNKITQHIELYPKLPLKAENFESILATILDANWKPNNHSPNEDMITNIDNINKPSCKAGIIDGEFLTISSHRTTKYKKLEDKIKFLDTRDYDSYLCLARPKNGKTHEYMLIYFDKKIINYNSLIWKDTYDKKNNHKGWEGTNIDKTIQISIIKSMSDQVWIKINKNLIKVLRTYEF